MSATFTRPEIIRPPSEHASYYLPLTAGCSNNVCSFCMHYGAKLQMRDIADVKNEIDAIALYRGNGIRLPGIADVVYYIAQEWNGTHVFLQDADALVYPYAGLREILLHLKAKLPEVDRVATYATAKDILRLTITQLKELRELNLKLFFMGLESGDAEILKQTFKGATPEEMVAAALRAMEAGITMSVTVILGLGGIDNSERHTLNTAKVLTAMDPEFASALTLMLPRHTPLYQRWRRGEFNPIDARQSLVELKKMLENINFTNCFFSSMHSSNYLAVRGRLPQDKSKMLRQIELALEQPGVSALRPGHLRNL